MLKSLGHAERPTDVGNSFPSRQHVSPLLARCRADEVPLKSFMGGKVWDFLAAPANKVAEPKVKEAKQTSPPKSRDSISMPVHKKDCYPA
eukprot:scaffold255288_cov21-Tisochrysis_lutea.AAC.1